MTGESKFYVIEFKDPPVLDLDRYICVPKTWTRRPFTNTTSDPASVVVKYPLEKQATTKSRVRRYEDYDEEWRIYIASVKYESEKYKDALTYINLLNKSHESYDWTTNTEPNESIPSNAQVSSAKTPINKKTGIKKKSAGKSQNKESTNDENSTQQASVIDVAMMCKSVVEELKNIKQELVGLLNNTLPMIESLQTTVSQNSVMLEKIFTLVNKPNRPDIDNTVPNVSRKITQYNAEGEIGNKTKTAERNNPATIDDPKTHDITTISEDEDTAAEVETDRVGIPQSTRVIRSEDAPPMRNGTKRKLADDDTNVPIKKRDGPRNHTLQNRQNDSGITLSNNTQSSPVIVESIPGTNRELMIVPQELLKFVHDAFKMSLLYTKS